MSTQAPGKAQGYCSHTRRLWGHLKAAEVARQQTFATGLRHVIRETTGWIMFGDEPVMKSGWTVVLHQPIEVMNH